ncbi:hypothetical protein L1887_20384 [Cichorium endivia]|nr:hypothetical protein L1887_20384 [Cichorium endivia]
MAMRDCRFAFVIIFLLMITQLSAVHGRRLEPTLLSTATIAATECEQSGGGMADFTASSTNDTSDVTSSSRRLKMRSLEYILASGPSKRGPGH